MNNRRKTSRGKKHNGTKIHNRFLSTKKVRGKTKKYERRVKIHSVTDVDFVMSTSFAKYKIPRSSKIFKTANRQGIQKVACYAIKPSRREKGRVALHFYWQILDTIIDTDNLKDCEIS